MKKLQINTDKLLFLSVIRSSLAYGIVLAVLLAHVCGCDGQDDRTEPPPAVASQREVAGLEKALADDAAKNAQSAGKAAETNVAVKSGGADVVKTPAKEKESGKISPPPPPPPPPTAVVGFESGIESFSLNFSEDPDTSSLLNYVKVTPNPGPITQGYYSSWYKKCNFAGAFKPRTKYTVTVRAGLPMKSGRVTKSDFVRTWVAPDMPKSVEFASNGRYLPAAGRRSVAIRTMNVTNLFCQIRMIPPRNIVQMLAREEEKYRNYYASDADSSNTQEISGEPVSRPITVKNRLNEFCETPLVVRNDDGETANGIYLISAEDQSFHTRTAWKVVCVTDIGLSVRRANGSIYVWATSLTKGTPIKGLRVLVYGSNNVEMGEGLTDADGWCACEMPDAGTPFAVVASCMDGSDTSFIALAGELDETATIGNRRSFFSDDETEAFVWSDRGIYRHNEPIFIHSIVRNGKGNAPKPMPLTIALIDPEGKDFKKHTQVTDVYGVITRTDFAVPDDRPGGRWTIEVRTPGDYPFVLGSRTIKIEEFVPPQIRVKVDPPSANIATTGMLFSVTGEHLFGGPAKGLPAEGAVMFSDAPFAPRGWEKFRFGDDTRRINPNFQKLGKIETDEQGRAVFSVDFEDNAKPAAAVKMTVQGSVFEAGGRPASARATTSLHYYPYYIGVAMPEVIRENSEAQSCRLALVNPDGTPHPGARTLKIRFESIEQVYELRKNENEEGEEGWFWNTHEVRTPVGDEADVAVSDAGIATIKIPRQVVGDYAVHIVEEATDVSFGAKYCVNGKDDPVVRTALENPSRVTLAADKKVYYAGERPKITVKSPFPGYAWLNVLRKDMLYSQVFMLTNATSEIVLEPVKGEWMPSLDVAVSVVQAARAGQRKGVMNRAYGLLPIRIATHDSELDVKVKADVVCAASGGSHVTVELDTKNKHACGERAVVTVTDEGIHMLTDEKTPDPVSWFGAIRDSEPALWDIYHRLLPVLDDKIRRADAKTGGGGEGDLFRRVSPVPTRRFKPLSMWQQDVELKDGRATAEFTLPEFVGEVRVTAVACGKRAKGAGSVQAKVAPNLVMQPDAPRFAAPGDTFMATVMFSNRSGKEGSFTYDLMAAGAVLLDRPVHGELKLADGASEMLTFPVKAGDAPGEGSLVFVSEGMGEKHTNEIKMPVRPAAPWVKSVDTLLIKPGESVTMTNTAAYMPDAVRRTFVASGNPVAELASALEYLISYPYGCLEQTTARVFPLITSGGILNTLPVNETSAADTAKDVVNVGISRVCSMIRSNDFTMWPDSDYAPWNRNVSLWAAHFLVEAQKNGFTVPQERLSRVKGFLRTWSMSTNETTSIYALHTLAIAGTPDRDRMLTWFDKRTQLPAISRARLARAFRNSGDPVRARELIGDVHSDDLKTLTFVLLALLEEDPSDARVVPIVKKILGMRTNAARHWDTTEGNAHALLALGAYYRTVPPSKGKPELSVTVNGNADKLPVRKSKTVTGCGDVIVSNSGEGDAYLSVSTLALSDPAKAKVVSNGISVARRYLYTNGKAADLSKLTRGEMLIVEVTMTAPHNTVYSDLVIEELLPACFEADANPVEEYPWLANAANRSWELRREMRDDRMLAFSTRFTLHKDGEVCFRYSVRVVSAGEFVAPGPSVEAMYDPGIRACGPAMRIKIEK